MMESIVLIGFMGSGKTTIGRALKEKTGFDFVDTDELIEAEEGCKISSIFTDKGEKYFRELEKNILQKLVAVGGFRIVSTGGGIVTTLENIPFLKKLGRVFYLRIKPETVIDRLRGDVTRPLLAGKDRLIKVKGLMDARKDMYEKAADIIIDADDISVEKIVEMIINGT